MHLFRQERRPLGASQRYASHAHAAWLCAARASAAAAFIYAAMAAEARKVIFMLVGTRERLRAKVYAKRLARCMLAFTFRVSMRADERFSLVWLIAVFIYIITLTAVVFCSSPTVPRFACTLTVCQLGPFYLLEITGILIFPWISAMNY